MKCKIISITHKPSDWERQAIQFYSKQLPNHFQVSYSEVNPFSSKSMNVKSILEAEGEEILKHVEEQAPLGRIGTVDEVIGAAILLASKAGSFITGQVITMDGGVTIAGRG